MRVSRPVSNKPTTGISKAKAAPKGGFSNLVTSANSGDGIEQTAPNAAAGGVAGVGGVESIMALQGVDNTAERRNRALRKGRRMMDALDRLQLSILDGHTSQSHLGLLQRALSEVREESGDDGLDNALGHVEVRTAVEIAKLERQKKHTR